MYTHSRIHCNPTRQRSQPNGVGCSVAVELVDRGNNCYRPVTNARQPAFASYAIGGPPFLPSFLPPTTVYRLVLASLLFPPSPPPPPPCETILRRSLYFLIKITLMLPGFARFVTRHLSLLHPLGRSYASSLVHPRSTASPPSCRFLLRVFARYLPSDAASRVILG